MRRARGFAQEYDEAALKRFLGHRKPNGLPLHVGYIPYLLTVKDAEKRQEFEEKAAEHGWTVPELITAIQRDRPLDPKAHGRTVKSPADVETGLQQLVSTGVLWVNRSEVVMELVRSSKSTMARQRLLDAVAAFEKLGQRAMEAAEELGRTAGRRRQKQGPRGSANKGGKKKTKAHA
jgi:Arc/MetJ-type ribon-helix-helix transcriptional regulator